MQTRIYFFLKRLRERLWVRPLALCAVSVAAALLAKAADQPPFGERVLAVTSDSIETLLSITAGSMLVIATLAVTSMVSAFAAASARATPRSFSLLVSDDLSQNALSTFLGAFIFTFVALVALKNDFYGRGGLFALFIMTAIVVAIVIVVFVRWVDWIARLGRIGTTIDKVEAAGTDSLRRYCANRRLGGAAARTDGETGRPVYGEKIGYVQHVEMEQLQAFATRCGVNVALRAVPGTFVAPGYPLAFLHEQTPSRREGPAGDALADADVAALAQSFEVGRDRTYDEDPRFAFIALSEIASRALSPAVNDPGTAIAIFGSFLRLFSVFAQPLDGEDPQRVRYDRVYVNELSPHDMLEDAFRAAARDGGALVEVQIRLQKTLRAIAELPNAPLADAARAHARAALERAVQTLDFEEDRASVAAAAAWSR